MLNSKKNTSLEANPLLPVRKENIELPDPLIPGAPPVAGAGAFLNMPAKFDFDGWKRRLIAAPKNPIAESDQLPKDAENLLASFLSPLQNQLQSIAENGGEQIGQLSVRKGDEIYKIAKTEVVLNEMFQQETDLVNKNNKAILEAFDKNIDNFKDNFMKTMNEPNTNEANVEIAREALMGRIKLEQKKLNDQKTALEKEIINAIHDWQMLHSRARYINELNRLVTSDKDRKKGIEIAAFNTPALPAHFNDLTFFPGEGKKFNLLDAFFKGKWTGTVYGIKNGQHTFNPKDPDAINTFVKFARAQNDGVTTRVVIELGGGTKSDYTMYGTLNPNNSPVLHHIAMKIACKTLCGLEDRPSAGWNAESLRAYYENNNGTIPEEFKSVDLEMPPIPILEFKDKNGKDEFTYTPADEEEIARGKGIRKELVRLRVLETEKRITTLKAKSPESLTEQEQADLEKCTTLRSEFNTQLQRMEKLDPRNSQKVAGARS